LKCPLFALALASVASAHIRAVSIPSNLQVTSTSTLPVTFSVVDGATTFEDFSVAIGLGTEAFVSPNLGEEVLGNYDLVDLRFSASPSNFTINVPLTEDNVSNLGPSGQFVVVAAITSGIGARYGTQVRFFNQTTQLQF